jgi:hypothetical protein
MNVIENLICEKMKRLLTQLFNQTAILGSLLR